MPSLADISRYVAPVGAQVVGGLINRRATSSATRNLSQGADTAARTINSGNDLQQRLYRTIYGEQKDALNPFIKTGVDALPKLSTAADAIPEAKPFQFDSAKFWSDPNIQRRIEEGNKLLARKQSSSASLRSGAAIKAARDYNDYQIGNEFGTEYNRQEKTFRDDQAASRLSIQDRINALLDEVGIGQTATGQQVIAGDSFARASGTSTALTSQQLADLQTEKASALAMGDVAKANSITDMINGVSGAVEAVGLEKRIASLLGRGVAPAAAGLTTAASLAGGVAAPSLAAVNSTLGGMAASGIGFPAAGAAPAAGGGMAPALGAFLTNPITIGVAAAIGIGTLWAKSQAHHEARDWTDHFQDPFDQTMAAINEDPQLDAANKAELQKANVIDYLAAAMNFAQKKGSDGQKVIRQSMREFRKWYPTYASLAVA